MTQQVYFVNKVWSSDKKAWLTWKSPEAPDPEGKHFHFRSVEFARCSSFRVIAKGHEEK